MRQKFSVLFAVHLLVVLAFTHGRAAHAQQPAPLQLDATAPIEPVAPADYSGGASRAPDGSTLGVTDRYLTRNGKPWLPVMGELHFSRLPESDWEDAILRMKASGVDIISTYIIWIHHEEIEGQWDWSGQRDLHHFAELCQKHGMLLYPRIGPWAHAEARNGGLPDWVIAAGPIRQEDPRFLAATRTFYDQIGAQLRGLLWKEGGPVIGIQIENEYAGRGAGQGAPYLLALKQMAIAAGLDAPLYTLTGWDHAVLPPHEFLPVYGGYPDAPWGSSRTALPPQEVYAFRFGSRVSGNMGMIGPANTTSTAPTAEPGAASQTPFLTAEIGGGMQDTYHRRLVIAAPDIAAIVPVMLGSGVNLYGSYMYTGGQNPEGTRTTLQESQATHYPTDVPEKSYDFQAPIGEYGLERQSLRLLKTWNYFLNAFGEQLAPMPAFRPAVLPAGPTDLSVLRWSVRTDGRAGFLFLNNYVRGASMPAHSQVRFAIALSGGHTLTFPTQPIGIPSGAYFAWPFGLDLGGLPLRYGTAQLVTRLDDSSGPTFVFSCLQSVRCELALEGESLSVQPAAQVKVRRGNGLTLLMRSKSGREKNSARDLAAGSSAPLAASTVQTASGGSVHLLLLAPGEADDTWRVPFAGSPHLLRTRSDLFADEAGVTLRQLGAPVFRFTLYPRVAPSTDGATLRDTGSAGFTAAVPAFPVSITATATRPAGEAPPVSLGPPLAWRPVGVAQAPSDATWNADAAQWSLQLQPGQFHRAVGGSGVSNLFLRIPYAADAARLLSGSRLLDDDFFNGEPWLVGLRRYSAEDRLPPLTLQLLPMRADSPVYLPPAGRSQILPTGQTLTLGSITVVPQYQLHVTPAGGTP